MHSTLSSVDSECDPSLVLLLHLPPQHLDHTGTSSLRTLITFASTPLPSQLSGVAAKQTQALPSTSFINVNV